MFEAKKEFPRGKVPVLEVDGKMLCEIAVILKYLGDAHGLTPKGLCQSLIQLLWTRHRNNFADPWQAAKALEVAASYSDLYCYFYKFSVSNLKLDLRR